MDYGWAALRVLHIVFGTIWVGSDFLLTVVVFPGLRALGPDVERPMMADLARRLPAIMSTSSIVVVVTGIWMTGVMQGWNLGWMFANGWGTMIAIGLVCTMLAFVIGLTLIPPATIGYVKLMRAVAGRQPSPEEGRQLLRLGSRARTLALINTILLLITAATMALARVA